MVAWRDWFYFRLGRFEHVYIYWKEGISEGKINWRSKREGEDERFQGPRENRGLETPAG